MKPKLQPTDDAVPMRRKATRRSGNGLAIALFLSLLAGCFLYRPAMKLNGFVSDARSGNPIGGARVKVGDFVTYTTETGSYVLKAHRKPEAVVEVSAPGYETSEATCNTPTRYPVCDFVLTPNR